MSSGTGSILLRRGPTTDRLAFCPQDGELIFDTVEKKVYVGDGITYGGKKISSDLTLENGQIINIPNSALENSTISGVSLGSNLRTLTLGTGLSGTSYNGSTNITAAVDASSTNSPSKVVIRDGQGNFAAGTITATLSGNASTATKLASPVTINGTPFDGSLNVTVTASASTLTGTSLNPAIVTSNLTSIGTLTNLTVTNTINGNASSVTNGVYTTGAYANPSWITSLSETKVLPSQSGNSGKYLSTNGTVSGWVSATSIGFPTVVGNSGKFLTNNGSDVLWGEGLPPQSGNSGKYLTTNGTVSAWSSLPTTLISSTNTYSNPTWISSLAITQGGTGATDRITALGNLLPENTTVGVVLLKSSGPGIFYWDTEKGTASSVTFTPAGTISSTTVQDAIQSLDTSKAPLASPAFTGTVTGITATMVGLGNVTNESKATMFTDPSFTGTVSGITKSMVGLGNVTNESKATMFTSPAFTGTTTGITATMVGLGNVTNESKATMFTSPAFTGTVTGITATMVGLGNVTNESKATMFTSPNFTSTISFASSTLIGSNREYVGFREKMTSVGTVSSTTYNLDLSLSNIFDVTLGANVTFTFINPPPTGVVGYANVILRQPASSPGKLATFTNAHYTDGVAPVLTTTANAIDVISFFTLNGGTYWFGAFAMANVI